MKVRTQEQGTHPGLVYETVDCLDMSRYGDCTFDAAIDKSTLDCLLSGNNAYENVPKFLLEV